MSETTLARVSGRTAGDSLITRETVFLETSASRADVIDRRPAPS